MLLLEKLCVVSTHEIVAPELSSCFAETYMGSLDKTEIRRSSVIFEGIQNDCDYIETRTV